MNDLHDDWDGQGAVAPKPENVTAALEWVGCMRHSPDFMPPSQVAPGVNGEVLLVWQDGSTYLEAEICAPYKVEWMRKTPERTECYSQLLGPSGQILFLGVDRKLEVHHL